MRVRPLHGAAVFAVGVLAVTQLALPLVAERRLRDELAASGKVRSVDVSAFPALKLLAGRADRVEAHLSEARLEGGRLAELLDRTERVGELDATADTLRVGPLLVRDARITKRGEALRSRATLTDADLAAALPASLGLRPVDAEGEGLVLEASVPIVGTVRARLSARDGAVVVAPEGAFAALATLTLFRDERVHVTAVGARPRPDGFTVTADARLS